MKNNINTSAAGKNSEKSVEVAAVEEKVKKSLSKSKKVIWIIIGIFVFIITVQVVVADKYAAQVLVIKGEKKVGVNPTTERLDFGDLSGDTSAVRYISLRSGGVSTYVYILKFGSIAELIDINENGFTLKEGDEKKIEFNLYMPLSAPIGEKYTGKIWIFKIPRLW